MTGRFAERAAAVAAVAAAHADEVDAKEMPPIDAVLAMKEQKLFSIAVPVEFGGEGATLLEISEICTTVGAACANAGMLYAMHQSQASCLWRHGSGDAITELISRLVAEELLLGSATTEKGIGGMARTSGCAFSRPEPGRLTVVKDAPVLSYAEYADVILMTARSSDDAPASDQHMLACPKSDYTLEKTSQWNALGLRGTASNGYILSCDTSADLLLDDDYGRISAFTALPLAHILWSSVWLGIATAAVNQARATVRKQARVDQGFPPPGQVRLAETMVELQRFSDTVRHSAQRYDQAGVDESVVGSISYSLAMNALKIGSANAVVDIVLRALRIVGINGYRLDTPNSLSRNIRDALGAPIQINNDRLLTNNAPLTLLSRIEA